LRDKEPEKRENQSDNDMRQDSTIAALPTTEQTNHIRQQLHLPENISRVGIQPMQLQDSLQSNSSYPNLSIAAQLQRADLLQQQQRAQQALLQATYGSMPFPQWSNVSQSARPDVVSMSLFDGSINGPSQASSILASNQRQGQNINDAILALSSQSHNVTLRRNAFQNNASFCQSTLPTLEYMRQLQQFTNTMTARELLQQQQQLDLQRRMLFDQNIQARYFAVSNMHQPLIGIAPYRDQSSSDANIAASRTNDQIACDNRVDFNPLKRLSSSLRVSIEEGGPPVLPHDDDHQQQKASGLKVNRPIIRCDDDRKPKAGGATESSSSSSSVSDEIVHQEGSRFKKLREA
jgi:hypothetical protein